jgi:tetratricopeptide (TPR) repeat protein
MASVYDDIGEYSRAVEYNLKDLAIYQDMVRADSKNALLQQGLAITYTNTAASCARAGKIVLAMDYSDRALEILRPLVSSASKNSFQQGIFATMLVVRGTILMTAKRPDAAITEIEQGRSIYESQFKAGSANQVNVAAADVKLGEAATKAGHEQKAENYFHQSITIVEPLISTEPADLEALYAAADAYTGLGELSMKSAQQTGLPAEKRKSYWTDARLWYVQSLNTWRRIEHPNHTSPKGFQVGDPTVVARELKQAESALASFY